MTDTASNPPSLALLAEVGEMEPLLTADWEYEVDRILMGLEREAQS